MAAAIVLVCIDYRLNHELLRVQVRRKLGRLALSANRIYILNEVGGNVGSNFQHTVDLLVKQGEPIVFCAVLHHDDCHSAEAGLRAPLETSAQQIAAYLRERQMQPKVFMGTVRIQHNHLLWSDEPVPKYRSWTFSSH